MTLDSRWLLTGALLLVLACAPETSTASGNAAAPAANPTGGVAPTTKITLSDNVGVDAVTQTIAAAKRQRLTEIKITPTQSFGLTVDGRRTAAILTGEAKLADGNPGCFVAIVQGGRVSLVPTIGQGNYETEACDKATAIGILMSSRYVVRIGALFTAYSPSAEVSEPVVLNWSRSTGVLSIDEALSRRASEAGAQSIAAIRRVAGR